MSSKAFKEIKGLSKDELNSKEKELRALLFNTKIQQATGQLQNTASLWKARKALARVKTLQTAGKSAGK